MPHIGHIVTLVLRYPSVPAPAGEPGRIRTRDCDDSGRQGDARKIKDELRVRIKALADRGIVPGLGTVLVGDDPGSHSYVAGKHRDCAELGIASIRRDLPATATQAEVLAAIARTERRSGLRRIHRAAPAPEGSRRGRRARGRRPGEGRGRTAPGQSRPARAGQGRAAAVHAARHRGTAPPLRRADRRRGGVVVGRGTTVGRPLGLLLTRKSENATVTLCHTGTRDLAAHVRNERTSWWPLPAYQA